MLTNEWSEVVATCAPKWLKEVVNTTLRDRVIFAKCEKMRRIAFGESGPELRWPMKYMQPAVQPYTGGAIDYAAQPKHGDFALDWRALVAPDKLDEKEYRMNQSDQQVIDRYARIMPDLEESIKEKLGDSCFTDGSTFTDQFHGLESMLAFKAGEVLVTDVVAPPASTYGGKSCVPGSQGGAWTATMSTTATDRRRQPNHDMAVDWPDGQGDSQFDCTTPRLVNYTSTCWTGTATWASTSERVLRQCTAWSRNVGGNPKGHDLYLMTAALYVEYLNTQAALKRIVVPAQDLLELGFEGVKQEGVSIMSDYAVPADTFYGLSMNRVNLHILGAKELLSSKGPEYDMRTLAWLFLVFTFGNWRFHSPKFFTKGYCYAAS